jgi:NAD(P)-dependent dehydrogenase (short-subunit alcohol dehydrogenase family)
MELEHKSVVVTGAARGIGEALARAFHAEGATVVLADVLAAGVTNVAAELDARRPGSAHAVAADVATEEGNRQLVAAATALAGPVDLFFANAGIAAGTDLDTPEDVWESAFAVNVHAHRWAARYLVPEWLARGEGYFCSTASAAGVLAQIGSAPYTLTKRAAVAFAEWLSITYGERGIKVTCLCPQGVNTAMLTAGMEPGGADVVRAAGTVLEPHEVAATVVAAIRAERFFVFPHPEVHDYMRLKADDPDRWLRGMRRLQARVLG